MNGGRVYEVRESALAERKGGDDRIVEPASGTERHGKATYSSVSPFHGRRLGTAGGTINTSHI